MNVDRILLLAREYASAYSLKDQSEVSRTWMNLKRALQEAAAPQQAEPVGEVRSETCHYSMMPDRICNKCGRVHGYSHPTAAPQRAEPALNERVGLAYKNGYEEALNDCIRNGGEAWARSMFANGGEHIKPQQAEPVAWMAFGGALVHAVTRNAMDPIEAERFDVPLYLHPPAAPQQAEPCDVCNALTVPRNATHYDADDLKAAQVRGKIIAAKLQQQAEPVAQIGWADEFGNLFPIGAWKPAKRTHHDSHKTAWRPVFLHPHADEVQQAEPVGDFQRSAPGKIWMNLGNDGMDEIEYPTWDALVRADENITWSEDRIDATDIPYVRADLAHPPAAEVQRLRDAAKRVTAAQSGSAFAINESINALRSALERGE